MTLPHLRLLRVTAVVCLGACLLSSTSLVGQLRPFSLPWNDDSATVTDFSGLNTPITTSSARISINSAGQLTRNGQRERMLGVNLTVDSAFPNASDAAAVAGRLAKFGFNAVRFHHLEAPWGAPNVLVDYTGDTSRNLSVTHLDRLHRFIAELAAEGIYTDMNLLVSRQFYANDGFPAAIGEIEWKEQQALSFFSNHMVTLQKEYAQKLLTAPNPHRGSLPLVDDPAVAFIEILNEYGYLQAWHDGTLDTLPTVFANELRDHWNAWLATRYDDTADLLAGWQAVDEPLGPQLLTNANFASGVSGWNLEQHDTAVAAATGVTTFTDNAPALRLSVTTGGAANWHVQLNQAGFALTAGQIYTASYWARSADTLPLSGVIGRAAGNYATLYSIGNATLNNTWQEFTVTFVATADEPTVRLNFNGFGNRTGTVEIAAVSFTTGGAAGGLPTGTSLESANVPVLLKNGGNATTAQKADWFRYLIASEQTYWDTMYSYIKDDLGFAGIVFGTIVANSPAGNQARLDAVDSHFYWEHPVFPNNPWDAVDWFIPNTSAVNSTTSHIGAFARQRVAGKPFFNTEYQHPAPNHYAAEAPLLPAAYGAFQDWDGFWFFEYGRGAEGWDRAGIDSFFAMDTDPAKMANVLLAANLFRRGDVSPASSSVTVGFDAEAQLAATLAGSAWSVGDASHLGLSARHAFETRVQLDVNAPRTAIPPEPTATILTADTGELRWDNSVANRGVVTVDTPRTKAVFGFAEGRSVDLEGWVFTPGDLNLDWLTAGVTTVSGDSLQSAAGFRALLILTGERASTGWTWTDSSETSIANSWGNGPPLIEVVPLTLDIPHPASRVSAWALDVAGARTNALTVSSQGSGARIELGQNGDTLWYEISVTADPTVSAPTIELHPNARLLAPGDNTTLSVTASGTAPLAYQWSRNGTPISGATAATLALTNVSTATAGQYRVTVTNAQGSVTTRAATVAVNASPPAFTGLSNLSTRTGTGAGSNALSTGFVLTGSGTKSLLLRSVGPGLAPYGFTTFLPDPELELYERVNGATIFRERNDDWDAAAVGDAFATVGAFPITPGSADSVLRKEMTAGVYSALIANPADDGKLVLVELYDMANGAAGPKLVNLSSRGFVGTGADLLIAGFVVPGDVPRRFLIRAVGPTLGSFGVDGTLADPVLEIGQLDANQNFQRLARNDDWFRATDVATLDATMDALGAFPLLPGSKDAAVIVELEPGGYSALVRGANDTTGIALVEIYAIE